MNKHDNSAVKFAMICVSLIALFFLNTCDFDKDSHEHNALTTGKELFSHHCAGCHKETGRGNFIKGVPSNILTKLEHRQIIEHIRGGERQPSFFYRKIIMPSFTTMGDEEIESITSHLLSLKKEYIESHKDYDGERPSRYLLTP
jgi:mono/diheme cytochrome c family protein